MRRIRPLFACLVTLTAGLLPPFGVRAADDSLKAVFARMDEAAAKFKGLTASVKKVSHIAVINEDSIDTGTIAVKRVKPHDFRMVIDFEQPDPKKVGISGTKVDLYYPKTNTVQEFDFGKTNKSQVEQFLLMGFGSNSRDLEDAYLVSLGGAETVSGEKTTRIVLVPKSKELLAQFPKFELWMSDQTGISVQQKVYQRGGDYSMATYTNMQIVPNIPDSAVNLNLPKGVKKEYPQK